MNSMGQHNFRRKVNPQLQKVPNIRDFNSRKTASSYPQGEDPELLERTDKASIEDTKDQSSLFSTPTVTLAPSNEKNAALVVASPAMQDALRLMREWTKEKPSPNRQQRRKKARKNGHPMRSKRKNAACYYRREEISALVDMRRGPKCFETVDEPVRASDAVARTEAKTSSGTSRPQFIEENTPKDDFEPAAIEGQDASPTEAASSVSESAANALALNELLNGSSNEGKSVSELDEAPSQTSVEGESETRSNSDNPTLDNSAPIPKNRSLQTGRKRGLLSFLGFRRNRAIAATKPKSSQNMVTAAQEFRALKLEIAQLRSAIEKLSA